MSHRKPELPKDKIAAQGSTSDSDDSSSCTSLTASPSRRSHGSRSSVKARKKKRRTRNSSSPKGGRSIPFKVVVPDGNFFARHPVVRAKIKTSKNMIEAGQTYRASLAFPNRNKTPYAYSAEPHHLYALQSIYGHPALNDVSTFSSLLGSLTTQPQFNAVTMLVVDTPYLLSAEILETFDEPMKRIYASLDKDTEKLIAKLTQCKTQIEHELSQAHINVVKLSDLVSNTPKPIKDEIEKVEQAFFKLFRTYLRANFNISSCSDAAISNYKAVTHRLCQFMLADTRQLQLTHAERKKLVTDLLQNMCEISPRELNSLDKTIARLQLNEMKTVPEEIHSLVEGLLLSARHWVKINIQKYLNFRRATYSWEDLLRHFSATENVSGFANDKNAMLCLTHASWSFAVREYITLQLCVHQGEGLTVRGASAYPRDLLEVADPIKQFITRPLQHKYELRELIATKSTIVKDPNPLIKMHTSKQSGHDDDSSGHSSSDSGEKKEILYKLSKLCKSNPLLTARLGGLVRAIQNDRGQDLTDDEKFELANGLVLFQQLDHSESKTAEHERHITAFRQAAQDRPQHYIELGKSFLTKTSGEEADYETKINVLVGFNTIHEMSTSISPVSSASASPASASPASASPASASPGTSPPSEFSLFKKPAAKPPSEVRHSTPKKPEAKPQSDTRSRPWGPTIFNGNQTSGGKVVSHEDMYRSAASVASAASSEDQQQLATTNNNTSNSESGAVLSY